jgi:hypothetical protein
MNYRTLDDIYALMESAQARFLAAVDGMTEAQINHRPAPDAWTIAEIAEHLSITNNGFLRITHKLLKQAEAAGVPALDELNLQSVLLLPDGSQPPPFAAPERIRPQGGQALSDSLAKLAESLAGFHELRPRLIATNCSNEKFPHPAVGDLNAYQWMIVQGEHLDRHRGQVERIKVALSA